MDEPANLSLAVLGSLADNDPWHLELWGRDDANAVRDLNWHLCNGQEPPLRLSWQGVQARANGRKDKLTPLGATPGTT